MATGNVFGISTTALLAFQRALATTGHNIANVNTPGYSRQRVDLVARPPQYVGGGFMGAGVIVDSVTRVTDEFLTGQVRASTSAHAEEAGFHALAAQVDALLSDPEAGLLPGLEQFFNGLQDLADHPDSVPVREALIGAADSLVGRFAALGGRLDDLNREVNARIGAEVEEINALARAIADLNVRIVQALGIAQGDPPNDLLDQRDEALRRLAEHVGVTVVAQDDGAVNVFLGRGQVLVQAAVANELAAVEDAFDPSRLTVAFRKGSVVADIGPYVSGGALGGVLRFRGEILDPAARELGRLAVAVSDAVNDQHRLGTDLDGNLGGDFFTDLAATAGVGLASRANAASTDVTVAVEVTDVAALAASDYRIDFDGSDYTVRRLADNQVVATVAAAGFPQTIDLTAGEGLRLTLSGSSVSAGDAFLVRPTARAAAAIGIEVGGVREIAAAAPILAEADLGNTGSATVTLGEVSAGPPPDPNLQQTVTITFNDPPTSFDVSGTGTGNPTGVAYTPGAEISYNGWTIRIDGAPAAGDRFTVRASTGATGDNRNALAMAALRERALLEGGTLRLADAYGATVASVGSATREAEVSAEAQQALLDQAVARREAVAGVNLDEEAANLLRLQQAYQAAAQVIRTASTLFDTLLAAVGR
ncbi:flagellar hook-associated protein FlgK [Inmirania thermothiophila]|uniref:Flagellar hook-associated protein 1 n=1 Tax=Inmirania thermothiophila TaxID=1750597 RepID=A0A3N1Y816_9GAMM|nr:flagellar hook-associated protein FlgK [Inmirania thermothiophila]ROR34915.1 flagellar hook-associated protein 1 FlgK [Inmirania thermothiophila]